MMANPSSLTEMCLDPNIHVDDAPCWIPELDNPYLHGACVPTLRFNALIIFDNDTCQTQHWGDGEGVHGSESIFATRNDASRETNQGDDYLINFAPDKNDWSAWRLVFDAKDISRGPPARIKLPHRVPVGFHAMWARGEEQYTC